MAGELAYWNLHAIKHRNLISTQARLSHISRGFAFYLGEDTLDRLEGKRVWVVEASACERDSRSFLAGLSLHQGGTFPTSHRQGPHALSYRRRAAIMDALAHEYRALQASREARGELRPRRAAARAGLGLRAARFSEARPERTWENSVVRARVRSKKGGHQQPLLVRRVLTRP